jgi:integrase
MAGQLIPRGEKIWLVRIFLGRDSQTGKRKYHNKTIRGNKKDAQKYLNGTLRELDLGTFVEPSSITLDEYLNTWLETSAKKRVRERTYVDYQYVLNRYVRPDLGNKKLSDLRPLDIQLLYSNIQQRGLSARIVHYAHALLSSSLKQAVRWGLLSRNPATLVDLPKQNRKEMKALSPEEAARFIEAAAKDRWGVLFVFALATGMRPEEYLGIQWKDVDLEQGLAIVQRTVVWRAGGGWYFSEPKTSSSRRNIPIPKSVLIALREHRRSQVEERLKAGPKYQNNDFVFATSEGTPLMRANITNRHFKPILKSAGLPESFRLYDLRHSCATLLLAANENPKVVSERLGHASISITLDIYSHVLPSMQQAATDKLEAMLFKKTGTL